MLVPILIKQGSEPVVKSSSVGSEYLQKWLERVRQPFDYGSVID